MIENQNCHKGFKTLEQANKSLDTNRMCDDCGGDKKRPTGLVFIHHSSMV